MKLNIYQILVLLIVITIFILPIGVIYVLNNGNPYTKMLVNHYIPKHLEQIGYSEETLLEAHYVEPKHTINNDFYHGHYMVIFKDDPNTVYYYGLKKKGKDVMQFCEQDYVDADGFTNTSTSGEKYSDAACISMYDNRD